MTTTTGYGTWLNRVDPLSLTVEQTIGEILGDYADDYDLDGLAGAYRAAINEVLPDSVTLSGNQFIGPYYDADCDFAGYPVTDGGRLDIKAIVDEVDFCVLAEQFDLTSDQMTRNS